MGTGDTLQQLKQLTDELLTTTINSSHRSVHNREVDPPGNSRSEQIRKKCFFSICNVAQEGLTKPITYGCTFGSMKIRQPRIVGTSPSSRHLVKGFGRWSVQTQQPLPIGPGARTAATGLDAEKVIEPQGVPNTGLPCPMSHGTSMSHIRHFIRFYRSHLLRMTW